MAAPTSPTSVFPHGLLGFLHLGGRLWIAVREFLILYDNTSWPFRLGQASRADETSDTCTSPCARSSSYKYVVVTTIPTLGPRMSKSILHPVELV